MNVIVPTANRIRRQNTMKTVEGRKEVVITSNIDIIIILVSAYQTSKRTNYEVLDLIELPYQFDLKLALTFLAFNRSGRPGPMCSLHLDHSNLLCSLRYLQYSTIRKY